MLYVTLSNCQVAHYCLPSLLALVLLFAFDVVEHLDFVLLYAFHVAESLDAVEVFVLSHLQE